jgi:FdhD protein
MSRRYPCVVESAWFEIVRVLGGEAAAARDLVAVEEPLEIRLGHRGITRSISITMRTPGCDFELAV